eukprot:GFYU01013327.1.p1 GENE.GFYU01013327.1~~GFYU01013327.1.p1  ORF type:complete len:185 (+),score=28.06 GFYU01013327.1:93-647(+)
MLPKGKVDNVVLTNVVRHVDSHNKIVEEEEMWRRRELQHALESDRRESLAHTPDRKRKRHSRDDTDSAVAAGPSMWQSHQSEREARAHEKMLQMQKRSEQNGLFEGTDTAHALKPTSKRPRTEYSSSSGSSCSDSDTSSDRKSRRSHKKLKGSTKQKKHRKKSKKSATKTKKKTKKHQSSKERR